MLLFRPLQISNPNPQSPVSMDRTYYNDLVKILLQGLSPVSLGEREYALLTWGVFSQAQAARDWGISPLHIASLHGFDSVARVLLQHGAPVDQVEKRGKTPLDLACFHGHDHVVSVLVANGASMKARKADRKTPLHSCCG